MTKQTKSERLFQHAFFEAKRTIESFGAGMIGALSSLHDSTDERICKRTVNDIRRRAERKLCEIEWYESYCAKNGGESIFSEADREAIAIVMRTCDNWERDEAEFKAHLAAL